MTDAKRKRTERGAAPNETSRPSLGSRLLSWWLDAPRDPNRGSGDYPVAHVALPTRR